MAKALNMNLMFDGASSIVCPPISISDFDYNKYVNISKERT